jgi:hypothetical protein
LTATPWTSYSLGSPRRASATCGSSPASTQVITWTAPCMQSALMACKQQSQSPPSPSMHACAIAPDQDAPLPLHDNTWCSLPAGTSRASGTGQQASCIWRRCNCSPAVLLAAVCSPYVEPPTRLAEDSNTGFTHVNRSVQQVMLPGINPRCLLPACGPAHCCRPVLPCPSNTCHCNCGSFVSPICHHVSLR